MQCENGISVSVTEVAGTEELLCRFRADFDDNSDDSKSGLFMFMAPRLTIDSGELT